MISIIKDLKLNYIQYGEGEDIVLLHGWGQEIQMMQPLGNEFTDYRITILDFPGFGFSEEPKESWFIEDYCEALESLLKELKRAADSGKIYTYHFNILRNILEKTAAFHGFDNFSACIKREEDDLDGVIYARMVNLLSHGNHSIFNPVEMVDDNKETFKKILNGFMENYKFNNDLFSEE